MNFPNLQSPNLTFQNNFKLKQKNQQHRSCLDLLKLLATNDWCWKQSWRLCIFSSQQGKTRWHSLTSKGKKKPIDLNCPQQSYLWREPTFHKSCPAAWDCIYLICLLSSCCLKLWNMHQGWTEWRTYSVKSHINPYLPPSDIKCLQGTASVQCKTWWCLSFVYVTLKYWHWQNLWVVYYWLQSK